MKTNKFYKIATIVLLVLNIGLVTFLVVNKRGHHKPGPLKAIKMLNLTDNQAKEFKGLAQAHHQSIMDLQEQQAAQVNSYFKSLYELPAVDNSEILAKIADLEKDKITITYMHFEEVRSLLDKGQLLLYQGFIENSVQKVLGKRGRKHPRK